MDRERILTRLQQLTGNLKPTERSTAGDLHALQRILTEHLTRDISFSVFGERSHHEGVAHLEATREPSFDRFAHLDSLIESSIPAEDQAVTPLVFRRATEFRNNLVGNSVPVWGSGMAASKSYGPFLDEDGLHVWFDLYQPVRMVSVCFKGSSTPVLLIPVWGTIAPKKNYTIQAGSVWIASSLIVNNSSLTGYYTGLKVTGGSLELSERAEVAAGKIVIKPGMKAILNLELDQNVVSASSADAGFDATAAEVKLPETCSLKFNTSGGKLTAADATCTVFGSEANFKFLNTAPVWIAPIAQILIPYSVKTTGHSPDVFRIRSSASVLCTLAKRARIGAASGWLLPAAKIDPQQLGRAAGTGALCIGLGKGISTNWKGLTESQTRLVQPAIITEPGMVTVADFFAENTRGRQKWVLWKNAATKHHSDITLGFGKAFPFIYVSSATGSEAVLFFCKHKASFDRPVDANGSPFVIESSIALASILQTGRRFRASLFDNDLLFDGNFNQPKAFETRSIVLRNAFFKVSRPYSLFLTGRLTADNEITAGVVVLLFGINRYLPTLPDPYVASYTITRRSDRADDFGNFGMGLAGFVKWPDPSQPDVAEDGTIENPAYVYFKFSPFDQSLLLGQSSAISSLETDAATDVRNFQAGVRTFNRNVISDVAVKRATLPAIAAEQDLSERVSPSIGDPALRDRISSAVQSGEMQSAINDLEANPSMRHISDKAGQVDRLLSLAVADAEGSDASAVSSDQAFSFSRTDTQTSLATQPRGGGLMFTRDAFMLLDVSSNADQMGVSWGTSIQVGRNQTGETKLRTVNTTTGGLVPGSPEMPLQILNMDVVSIGRNLRAITLPQVSWEPISNIPLKVEGKVAPDDNITVTPGLIVYKNDGIPTRIGSESPYPVPIAPLPVSRHFVKEFNDDVKPRQLQSIFTLPFAMIAQADFDRKPGDAPDKGARISFNRPYFEELRGGLQIKSLAPKAPPPYEQSPAFTGWTLQLDENTNGNLFGVPLTGLLRWVLFGIPIKGSTLGKTVKKIFNKEFRQGGDKPKVPVERMEFSGYGASIFSNWLDGGAAIAEVSQTLFDVLVGRTAHEIVQVRSILYPWGVHVVRTITLMRSANGYVFRSDSGWKAESDGFFDFTYKINFEHFAKETVPNSYEVHDEVVRGISNVREIKDYAAGSPFTSSFRLDDPDLAPHLQTLSLDKWRDLYQGKTIPNKSFKLDVEMQAVVFDADVHLNDVTSGGVEDTVRKDFKVQSRKMLGYVQLAPSAVLVPTRVFRELLDFQNGSLGGPVDCLLDIAKSEQKMRLSRVDVSAAKDGTKDIFVSAARGSLILPPDGSWSVVRQQTDTKDVKVLEEGQSVPLIKRNGVGTYRIAEPKDIVQPSSNSTFGVVQSTGTQKLLFDMPQFTPNVKKLKSAQTYFADAYKLLNSKGVFPNVANALPLTSAEREVQILGEGLMKMPEHDINVSSLMPTNFSYAFVNEPGILKIYAEYSSTGGAPGNLKLGINSLGAAADKWKAALSNIKVVVDLGPFERLMWVDGDFNAASGINAKYDKPNLQFGPMLNTVKDILQVLATLSGDDFDNGMSVGMSNSADSWEYKFNCSQEIPVLKFPSPTQLALNPNPPLKLEAGLKVGFYFNEVVALPTDLKQLVPACGAYVDFYGRMQVMCFTLGAASIYAVGQVNLGIAADSKAGKVLRMRFGFGVEIVVGLPVVGNVAVLYMVEISVDIDSTSVIVGAFMLFRGHAEICGGLVGVTIQIEAGGSIKRTANETNCIAQVTFSIDIQILWVIDISFSDTWQESRQIS
jgi:hypothetical protein